MALCTVCRLADLSHENPTPVFPFSQWKVETEDLNDDAQTQRKDV